MKKYYEKRKLEMIITSCEECPLCEYDINGTICIHEYSPFMENPEIYDVEQIKDDCPLELIKE